MLHVITSIPLNVHAGSGCYVGTSTLIGALRHASVAVELVTPTIQTPAYTTTRLLFNELLRWRRFSGDATIGIDADGYTVAGKGPAPHIACVKGVLADAVRFERGTTRMSMALQARLEREHARRADLVITISQYCAGRIEEMYGVRNAVVVPELIDLEQWRKLFSESPTTIGPDKFTVLTVCRFYPRKRVDVLLRAAAQLRDRIPGLQIRIVGDGPESSRLQSLWHELKLESIVEWLGDLSMRELASEYNRADVFCLPSAQEGFGIVFLEAMAAGKPIVGARSAAVPEVVQNGLLVEPDNPEALAGGILTYYRDPGLRAAHAEAGLRDVEQFEKQRVSALFLSEVAKVAPNVGKIIEPAASPVTSTR